MIRFQQIDIPEYFAKLQELLQDCQNDQELFSAIVNAPFYDQKTATVMSLGITVLLLVNNKTGTIDRIALSDTEPAKGAVNMSVKPFKSIKIPIDYPENAIAMAIKTNKPQVVSDWQYLFIPDLTPQEARFNQAGAGIGCSVVYPLIGARDGGAMIFSYYQLPAKIGARHHDFMRKYSAMAAKALGS